MFGVIRGFKTYLEKQLRLPEPEVVEYLGYVPIFVDHLEVTDVRQITGNRVQNAWKNRRWELTEDGIKVNEVAENGYLKSFKSFLEYLEMNELISETGLSEIIRLTEKRTNGMRKLSATELRQLREYLVFNVSNDTQRRETALVFFLLATGCSATAALSLNVHESGKILPVIEAGKSGHFCWVEDVCRLNFTDASGDVQDIEIPQEVLHFLNFYLENRKYQNRILFLSDARRKGPGRLSERAAETIVYRVLSAAGISCEKGNAIELLRISAARQSAVAPARNRRILVLSDNRSEKTDRSAQLKLRVA